MLNLKPSITPDDARYLAALALVAQIEAHLAYGRPLISKSGQRLYTLESAVRAALADDLPPLPSGEGTGVRGEANHA